MKTEYKKRYYSIKEVSQMTGLRSYVLRYWETVFPKLKPLKHSVNGRRMYTEKDIETVKNQRTALWKKYTIKGANEVMNSKVEIVQLNLDFENEKNYLKGEIKRNLNEVINILRGGNENKIRVYLLDDSITVTTFVSKSLSFFRHVVYADKWPNKCIKRIKEFLPDIIILDIDLNEFNGIDICKDIQEDEQLKEIPVIFLSHLTDTATVAEGLEAGAVDYIYKPIDINQLDSRIRIIFKDDRGYEG